MDHPIIEAKSVYAGYSKTAVLKEISFSVLCGESLCILGSNGCGKTTLLKKPCRSYRLFGRNSFRR
nr:ABC transporter ATP-binding protein [Treponema sp. OMZ 788]